MPHPMSHALRNYQRLPRISLEDRLKTARAEELSRFAEPLTKQDFIDYLVARGWRVLADRRRKFGYVCKNEKLDCVEHLKAAVERQIRQDFAKAMGDWKINLQT